MSADLDPAVIALMHAEFDAAFYLAANQDVADAGGDAFAHFITFGWREGRDPNPTFSIRRYLDVNADVKVAGVNAFAHYLTHGRAEGRPTDHGLGFRYEALMVSPQIDERIREQRKAVPDTPADPAETLSAALAALGPKPAIHVTVSHDNPYGGVGGVQLCIRMEAEAMRQAGRNHLHLFPPGGGVTIDIDRAQPSLCVVLNGEVVGCFAHEDVAEHLARVSHGGEIDLVVHSLIGHRVDRLTDLLRRIGVSRGWYWVHDFSSLCAGYALLRDDVVYCGAPAMSSLACEICAYGRMRRIQVSAHVAFFEAFDMTVVAPSESALGLWRSRFPVTPAAMTVHPHATLEPRRSRAAEAEASPGPLKIAFLGMPSIHKGWPVFADLAARFADDPRYAFHHLGAVRDPRVPVQFTRVAPSEDDPYPMVGAIEALQIDVAMIWSLWPETFCFAAFEALAGGAVIVTNPDAGNVADLVRADPERGRVIVDDEALSAFFLDAEAMTLARAGRDVSLADMAFSRMAADLVLAEVGR